MEQCLPRILIVDDLFGRHLPDGTNEDRDNLCASFMLRDVTSTVLPGKTAVTRQKIKSPIAEAVFIRGQTPDCPTTGDEVRNDLDGVLKVIRQGWTGINGKCHRWSMVLLDLCFYTGKVTGKLSVAVAGSGGKTAESGMPEGQADDIVPSKFFGLTVLRELRVTQLDSEFYNLPVVILSSQDRDKVSEQYSELGALAFLPRSSAGADLLPTYLDKHGLIADRSRLVVGSSLPMLVALRSARRTSHEKVGTNILLRGESGVGKGLFAKLIHLLHPNRHSFALETVNSATLSSDLFASELFGVEKGFATDVVQNEGAVGRANQGDLFLDEIKDMVPQAQAGILNFLQDRKYRAKGSSQFATADVRVISATNADLDHLVAVGRFRNALLTRLRSGCTVDIPSVRDCLADVGDFSRYLIRRWRLIEIENDVRDVLTDVQRSDSELYCLIDPGALVILTQLFRPMPGTLSPETLAELMACQLEPELIQGKLEQVFQELSQGIDQGRSQKLSRCLKKIKTSVKRFRTTLSRQITDEAIEALSSMAFTGNLRDLAAILTRVLADNDVEFIYPGQIEKARRDLGMASSGQAYPTAVSDQPYSELRHPPVDFQPSLVADSNIETSATTTIDKADSPRTIAELIATLNDFKFDLSNPDALYNQFDSLDEAATKLVVRYLLTSLRLNKDHATGEPEVTKAMKFASGKQKLATSAAYDVIKRLLKRNPAIFDWALTEPLLQQAYEQAESTRVSNRSKKTKS